MSEVAVLIIFSFSLHLFQPRLSHENLFPPPRSLEALPFLWSPRPGPESGQCPPRHRRLFSSERTTVAGRARTRSSFQCEAPCSRGRLRAAQPPRSQSDSEGHTLRGRVIVLEVRSCSQIVWQGRDSWHTVIYWVINFSAS